MMRLGMKMQLAATAVGLMLVAGGMTGCASKGHAEDGMTARVEAAASRAEMAATKAEKAANSAADAAQRAEAAAQKCEAMFQKHLRK